MSENANWHVPPARATGAKDVSIPARGCHGAFILGPAGDSFLGFRETLSWQRWPT